MKTVKPNQQFERLTVIRLTEKRKGKQYVLCRCKCGTEREFDIYSLLSGHAKSCGCLKREKLVLGRKTDDLKDQRFGQLTVLEQQGTKNRSALWRCICDCGNTVDVTARDLVSGNTTSCGCALIDHTKSLKQYNEQHHTVDGIFVPLLQQKIQRNNKTGIKGVSIHRTKNGVKYKANITINGKRIYLGLFPTIEAAAEARKKAEEKFHIPYIEKLNKNTPTE